MSALVKEIWLSTLLWFLALGSVAGLFVGAALIVRPGWVAQMGKYTNRWISTRNPYRELERWIELDNWFYQHHRVSGGLLLAGAVWSIVFFITSFDKHRYLADLSKVIHIPTQLIAGLLDAFVLMSMLGTLFAALISLLLLLRPSLLREFDQFASQWISMRRTLKPMEMSRFSLDGYVSRNTHLAGFFLLFGSLYILGMFVFWLH